MYVKKPDQREINLKQLEDIMQDAFINFPDILKYTSCDKCFLATVKDYKIYIDKERNVAIMGTCAKCGNDVENITQLNDGSPISMRLEKIYLQLSS